jgi:hypothetical protein
MRAIPVCLALSFALTTGCTSSSGSVAGDGQFTIPWVLHGPAGYADTSCDGLLVDHLSTTLTSPDTGDVITATAPCAAGTMLTDPLPVGHYTIAMHAFDTAGKQIDTMAATTDGWILKEGDRVVLPAQLVTVRMPDEEMHFDWHAPAKCGGDTVEVDLDDKIHQPMWMVWPCDQKDPTWSFPVPGTNLYVSANVETADGQPIAISSTYIVAATGGRVDVDLPISWP